MNYYWFFMRISTSMDLKNDTFPKTTLSEQTILVFHIEAHHEALNKLMLIGIMEITGNREREIEEKMKVNSKVRKVNSRVIRPDFSCDFFFFRC